jgi:hypothetical protein
MYFRIICHTGFHNYARDVAGVFHSWIVRSLEVLNFT